MSISSSTTEAEFALILDDVGVDVECDGVSGRGLFDEDAQIMNGESGFTSAMGAGSQSRGEIVGKQIVVTVISSDFADATIESDVPITVDGVDYVIRYALDHVHMALALTAIYVGKK